MADWDNDSYDLTKYSLQPTQSGPTPDFMLDEIVKYQEMWESRKDKIDSQELYNCKHEMLIDFIYYVNMGENIGIRDCVKIGKVVNQLTRSLTKEEIETKNIFNAWKCILDTKDTGMLTISMVKKIHCILMTGVIDEKTNTPAGEFSTLPRTSFWNEKIHVYPRMDDEFAWCANIGHLFEEYNQFVSRVKSQKKNTKEITFHLFKCATYILFHLISFHPFSDGNGRLCRILASYILYLRSPFPSTIYNTRNCFLSQKEYIDAIVTARENNTAPNQLCTMMIESHWHTWKRFFSILDREKSTFNIIY